jgi:hypothetical protein
LQSRAHPPQRMIDRSMWALGPICEGTYYNNSCRPDL